MDEAVLSMEAVGLASFKSCLIEQNNMKLLPGVAIYGKNGGGKSNVIRAFWLAVQFIRNAQRIQHEKATVPVVPFALNDYSAGFLHQTVCLQSLWQRSPLLLTGPAYFCSPSELSDQLHADPVFP